MPNLPTISTQDPIDATCYNLLTLLARGNQELREADEKAKSPKDIENCINKEIALIKLLGHKINTATAPVRRGYIHWGIKINSILEIVADLPVIEAWINWYKHQRSQQLCLIRETEAYLPTDEDFEILKVKYRKRTHVFYTECNSVLPGTDYRIRQAEYYAKVLHNIFCAPTPPPSLDEPLPPNYNRIHFDDIPKTRSQIARSIFDPTKNFGQTLERITKIFVDTAINTGATSELLPHMQIESVHTYLPDDHPIRLAVPSKTFQ